MTAYRPSYSLCARANAVKLFGQFQSRTVSFLCFFHRPRLHVDSDNVLKSFGDRYRLNYLCSSVSVLAAGGNRPNHN